MIAVSGGDLLKPLRPGTMTLILNKKVKPVLELLINEITG